MERPLRQSNGDDDGVEATSTSDLLASRWSLDAYSLNADRAQTLAGGEMNETM
jgi:hypothetical protein